MKEELDKALCEKYPKIFAQRHMDMSKTAMCWGFPGDGWYWLIDNLCDSIQGLIDANPHLKIPQVVATQVKEKFGSLRFYYEGGNDDIGGRISLAEDMSYTICEDCGSTDRVTQTKGWIVTLCHKCMEKRRLEKKFNK